MSYAIPEAWLSVASQGDGLRRITVVDDSGEFVDLLTEALYGRFVVESCPDPAPAAIAATRPDLLFVDPWAADGGRDGWNFVDRVRTERGLSRVPIVLCSTTPLEDDGGLERLRSCADVHFLSKPFALEQLESLISKAATKAH